jgi:PAS domain-containing protein
MSHPFICPNCGHRTSEHDRNLGFTRQRKGCEKCGFAFLFELLDDYFPAPDAAFFVCDGEGRIVGCGKNAFELTGVEEEEAIGQRVEEVLGLRFGNGDDPVATVLEWGVRALEVPVQVNGERDTAASAKADMFPAYDSDEGGLLLVLTPDR